MDIHWAVKTARYEEMMEGYDDKYLLLGSDSKGNPHTIMPRPGKPGVLTRMGLLSGELAPDVTEYIRIQAAATHRSHVHKSARKDVDEKR